MTHDITERKQLEQERATEKLSQLAAGNEHEEAPIESVQSSGNSPAVNCIIPHLDGILPGLMTEERAWI